MARTMPVSASTSPRTFDGTLSILSLIGAIALSAMACFPNAADAQGTAPSVGCQPYVVCTVNTQCPVPFCNYTLASCYKIAGSVVVMGVTYTFQSAVIGTIYTSGFFCVDSATSSSCNGTGNFVNCYFETFFTDNQCATQCASKIVTSSTCSVK